MTTRPIKLNLPRIATEGPYTYFCASYNDGADGELWFRTTDPVVAEAFDVSSSDAFLPIALLMAMERGKDLYFSGTVSANLLEAANDHLSKILSIQNPTLIAPKVTSEHTAGPQQPPLGVATGLSCGIDSFAAVYRHFYSAIAPSTKLTHLTNFNHAQRRHQSNGWERGLPRFQHAAKDIGLPLLTLGTNFAAQLTSPHTMSHAYLNSSCAIALDRIIGRYYYASTFQYRDINVSQTTDIAHADPIVLPLLSSRRITFTSTGSETARTLKTKRITDIGASFQHLEVCTKSLTGIRNCSACYKCLRTMATLDLLGKIDLYSEVFDLHKWRKQRSGYARKILLTEGNPYMDEMKELDAEQNLLLKWAGGEKRMQKQIAFRNSRLRTEA